MKTSDNGIELIKKFEGCVLKAYQDSVGVWTIGYGHTRGVKKGAVITQEQAIAYLKDDVAPCEDTINMYCKVPITQNQFDALVCFSFNVGTGALKNSTLLKRINAKDSKASDEFLRWNKAGGKVLAGLTKRRQQEKDLFDTKL